MKELELAGFIIRSSYRKQVFLLLDNPIRPSEIAKKLKNQTDSHNPRTSRNEEKKNC